MFDAERSEEVDLYKAYLAAAGVEILNSLAHSVRDRAHCHYDFLSVGITIVVEEPVVSAGDFRDLLHCFLDYLRERNIERVDCFSVLEEDIVVFTRVAECRVLGVQSVILESLYSVPIDELCHLVEIEDLDLLDLVGCTESVKEVLYGNSALDRAQMGNRAHIHTLLDAGRCQLCPACLAAGHDVLMVAEDGYRICTDGSGCNMHYYRKQKTGHSVHGWDHEHKAL